MRSNFFIWTALTIVISTTFATADGWLAQDTPTSNVQEETPFLWSGQIYAEPDTRISEHIRRQFGDTPFVYPSAASCLENYDNGTDLLEVDLKWGDLPDATALNVCFFRLFAALGSLEASSEWLSRRGWEVESPRDYPNLAHQYGVPEDGFRSFSARWNVRERGAPYGPEAQREWLERAVVQISIQSFWSPATGLVHVRIVESPGG